MRLVQISLTEGTRSAVLDAFDGLLTAEFDRRGIAHIEPMETQADRRPPERQPDPLVSLGASR